MTHRTQVEDTTGRIHRCLEEDRARLLAHLAAPNARLGGVEHRDVDPKRGELLHEEALCAAVDPRARQQMISRPEQREQRTGGGALPAGQHHGGLRALERGNSLLHELRVG